MDQSGDVRLDVWLDVACVFRTRSEAQKACKAGKVDVNGQSAKRIATCGSATKSGFSTVRPKAEAGRA
jgi:ribosomal 50S subunit-recycling heat shock protein